MDCAIDCTCPSHLADRHARRCPLQRIGTRRLIRIPNGDSSDERRSSVPVQCSALIRKRPQWIRLRHAQTDSGVVVRGTA